MKNSEGAIKFKCVRAIPAPPSVAFDAWMNPKVSGNHWNVADKLILNPKVNGLYYLLAHTVAHYGRFTQIDPPHRIQHTWVSRNTEGHESMVTVTFEKQEEGSVMTLVHSGLPDTDAGRRHEGGWIYFLDIFRKQFGPSSDMKARRGTGKDRPKKRIAESESGVPSVFSRE